MYLMHLRTVQKLRSSSSARAHQTLPLKTMRISIPIIISQAKCLGGAGHYPQELLSRKTFQMLARSFSYLGPLAAILAIPNPPTAKTIAENCVLPTRLCMTENWIIMFRLTILRVSKQKLEDG